MIQVGVINKSKNALPQYETSGAAGLDVRVDLERSGIYSKEFYLEAGQRTLFKTGLFLDIPEGYEVQVRPRSGLAFKHGVTVLNSPGTIDSDYKQEVGIILINHSDEDFYFKDGERLGQLVLSKVEKLVWRTEESIEDNGRGGFGHTNVW